MKIENLYEGMVIKNYKELCKLLEIKVAPGGNSKKAQFKELDTYCSYHKEGQKIVIDEIYSERKKKLDYRVLNKETRYPNFKVSVEDYDSIGVYKIQLDNKVYIGSTVIGFRSRFQEHNVSSNPLASTRTLLKNGGIFTIVEKCNGLTEQEIRSIENEWIKYYCYKEEYELVNEREAYSYKNGCSKKKKPPKPKYKHLKVSENDYEKLVKFALENNLSVIL